MNVGSTDGFVLGETLGFNEGTADGDMVSLETKKRHATH